ncbi:AAA family ATPase [Paenibacillus sp. PR3]|uniref:AAA family ATPase n=1 Tax=Paenibacillus terricola TaxID=2763503 RepID=A0ABR8MQA7_9BACL|nr:AAA family ATPase [Paenibacillus terricola]MBD3918185.1 AAA family ATPase [Paenibacillus terricola]
MRICIEGPSAVGKSTLCRSLGERCGFIIQDEIIVEPIPGLSPGDTAIYYLEREVERWNAIETKGDNLMLILDTDPMKPLWFNWSQGYRDCMPLDELEAFYSGRVQSGEIGFADLYIILDADIQQLYQRKENDPFRDRDNFEWISSANEHRRRYYQYLHATMPSRVVFMDAVDKEATLELAVNNILALQHRSGSPIHPVKVFDLMMEWLRKG